MTRQVFLDELKQALSGEIPIDKMMESYNYYANYIDSGIRSGKSEEEVLEELGKPALIARSIIAAQTGERQVDYEYTEDGRTRTVRNSGSRQRDNGKRRAASDNSGKNSSYSSDGKNNTSNNRQFIFNFSGILAKVAFVLFLILLVIIFFLIIKIGLWVLITFGIPILLILGIIYLIMYFTK